MSKSKYSSPCFDCVTPVQRGDTSRDASRADRTGTSSSGPTSRSNADKNRLLLDQALSRKVITEDR